MPRFGCHVPSSQGLLVFQLHLGELQLGLSLFKGRLSKREFEFVILRRELKQKVTLLHQLTGREVDLAQESFKARSHFGFAGCS